MSEEPSVVQNARKRCEDVTAVGGILTGLIVRSEDLPAMNDWEDCPDVPVLGVPPKNAVPLGREGGRTVLLVRSEDWRRVIAAGAESFIYCVLEPGDCWAAAVEDIPRSD